MSTRAFSSLASFARFTSELTIVATPTLEAGIAAVAKNLQREVKDSLGKPDLLTPKLSPVTVQLREDHAWGYAKTDPAPGVGPNDTLLWSGELRDSYEMESRGLIAGVGSENMKALWHEVGTRTEPARMPLRRAADKSEPENVALFHAVGGRLLRLDK